MGKSPVRTGLLFNGAKVEPNVFDLNFSGGSSHNETVNFSAGGRCIRWLKANSELLPRILTG